MDKHQIGVNAGKVWKLLNDNKRWSYCDLKRASELSDRDLNAAIGWLARENKIDFECSNVSTQFRAYPFERALFSALN